VEWSWCRNVPREAVAAWLFPLTLGWDGFLGLARMVFRPLGWARLAFRPDPPKIQ